MTLSVFGIYFDPRVIRSELDFRGPGGSLADPDRRQGFINGPGSLECDYLGLGRAHDKSQAAGRTLSQNRKDRGSFPGQPSSPHMPGGLPLSPGSQGLSEESEFIFSEGRETAELQA